MIATIPKKARISAIVPFGGKKKSSFRRAHRKSEPDLRFTQGVCANLRLTEPGLQHHSPGFGQTFLAGEVAALPGFEAVAEVALPPSTGLVQVSDFYFVSGAVRPSSRHRS